MRGNAKVAYKIYKYRVACNCLGMLCKIIPWAKTNIFYNNDEGGSMSKVNIFLSICVIKIRMHSSIIIYTAEITLYLG